MAETTTKGFKGKTSLGRKKALKKTAINVEQVEKIAKDIKANEKEKTSRASVIIPRSEYVRMKEALLKKEQEQKQRRMG